MKKITLFTFTLIFTLCSLASNAQTIGNLWGVTPQKGDSGEGTMFGFNPVTGNDSIIVPFSGKGGTYPDGNNLVQSSSGSMYGMMYEGGANGDGVIFKRTPSGKVTTLYSFGTNANDGQYPYGSLIIGSDGMLYGLTYGGGKYTYGAIIKCDTLGNETVLYSFGTNGSTDGEYPYYGRLVQAPDGMLYGATEGGGVNSNGTIFKCDMAGNEAVLYSFGTNANDGTAPYSSTLTMGMHGMLYGMTYQGGTNSEGTIFQCDTLGNEKVIYNFYATSSDAYGPYGSGLVQAPDGSLFGMTYYGGTKGYGAIFKCDTLGNETVLHSFSNTNNDGYYPYGDLVFGNGDTLYGLTPSGGANSDGALFKCDTSDGSKYGILYNFNAKSGDYSYGTPTFGADGNLYCMMDEGGAVNEGTIFEYNLNSAKGNVLYNCGTDALGYNGLSNFIQGKDGNLYGMADEGGPSGYGTIVKYDPIAGKVSVLHAFNDTTGSYPNGVYLTQGMNSTLYGITAQGGTSNSGVVFKCTTAGVFNVLYNFGTNSNDGYNPVGRLIIGKNGAFYGMTSSGGANSNGIIFKCDTLGNETILYSFGNNNPSSDGANPNGSLIQSARGTLYGMTSNGGANGNGMIFKSDTSGNETILYSFSTNPNDGINPTGRLVWGRDSILYGMTNGGGTGDGTIFKSDTLGNETVLHAFGSGSDGYSPNGSLIMGSDSNFYGATANGGAFGYGTLFKCDSLGNEAVIYSFVGDSDGAYPQMDLLEVMSVGAAKTITCSGSVDTAMVRGGMGPFTYSWSTGSTSAIDTIKTAGTYTVSVTDARGITVHSVVNVANSILSMSNTSASACAGSSTKLGVTTNGGIGSLTYSWMPGSLSGASPSVSPIIATTYTATVTDTKGCKDSAKEVVTVNPTPTVSITGTTTVCSGTGTTLTGNGADTYVWTSGPSTASYSVTPTSSTTYTVVGTSTLTTCSDTAKVTVTVNTTPTITVTGLDSIPGGSVDTLVATGGTTYSWTPGGSTSDTLFAAPANTTTYTVTGTSNGCNAMATFTVTIETPTSVNTLSTSNNVTAYPNPVSNTLNMAFNINGTTNSTIEVCDIRGKVVSSQTQTISNNETVHIDVNGLVAGVYFVKITTNKQTQTIRFVKQ